MNCIRNSRPSVHSRILSVRLAVTSFVLLFVISSNLTGWRVSASREATAPVASQDGLASVLQADGSLRAGVAGNFDASGYRMELTATGAPRFVPAQAVCGTADWDAQFGLPNGTDIPVLALAVMGNAIYVGGFFTAAVNVAANNVAKFDTTTNTWSALSQGNGNGVNDQVLALAVSGNSLFVGGLFTTVNLGGTGGTPAIAVNRVAKFDTSTNTWSALKQGDGNGVDGQVFALAVSGNSLFVGGSFATANQGGTGATPAINANNVAKFDTTANTWSALTGSGGGDGVKDDVNGVEVGEVNALAVKDCDLFVGGAFVFADNKVSQNIARYAANNTPPTITAMPVTRTAGSPSANSQIATVNDAEDVKNTLTITVNGAMSATVNGVTVTLSDLNPAATGSNPNAMGQVFADVVAACGASTASFTLRVTDSGGLFNEATLTVTVNPDNTPPTITCPSNTTTSTSASCAVVNYPAPTVSDNCPGTTASCSPPSGTCFPQGITTVVCNVKDASNNMASCSFTVTVTGPQSLSITCPSNISAAAAAACPIATGAPVNFTVTASGVGVTVVCKNQDNQVVTSGSPFPVGTTTVTCTATDASGNTANCSFTVTMFSFCLQDETNPGNVVLVNAQTGDFSFCCGGVTIASGRGTLTTRGCIGSIDASKGNRQVHIQWDTSANNGAGAGTAYVQKLSDKISLTRISPTTPASVPVRLRKGSPKRSRTN